MPAVQETVERVKAAHPIADVIAARDIKAERGKLLDRFRRGGDARLARGALLEDGDFH